MAQDITINGQYIGSTSNVDLYRFLCDAKHELRNTVRHRRGIIQGYQKLNLDSLLDDNLITESERKIATLILDNIYERLDM